MVEFQTGVWQFSVPAFIRFVWSYCSAHGWVDWEKWLSKWTGSQINQHKWLVSRKFSSVEEDETLPGEQSAKEHSGGMGRRKMHLLTCYLEMTRYSHCERSTLKGRDTVTVNRPSTLKGPDTVSVNQRSTFKDYIESLSANELPWKGPDTLCVSQRSTLKGIVIVNQRSTSKD